MKRLPSTYFIRNVGAVLRDARAEPVTVTIHGQDSVVILSAVTYKELVARTQPKRPQHEFARPSDPWRLAVSVVNTSRSAKTDRESLIQALNHPEKGNKALLRVFFSDLDQKMLAAVVSAGPISWVALARACNFVGDVEREKATFIRDMALLALDHPA